MLMQDIEIGCRSMDIWPVLRSASPLVPAPEMVGALN